jgi:hypothetical protein
LEGLARKLRIQAHERLAQPPLQHHVAVVRLATLRVGFARGDVRRLYTPHAHKCGKIF